jgi:hypothetical protein
MFVGTFINSLVRVPTKFTNIGHPSTVVIPKSMFILFGNYRVGGGVTGRQRMLTHLGS